jgi:hypothetical protein
VAEAAAVGAAVGEAAVVGAAAAEEAVREQAAQVAAAVHPGRVRDTAMRDLAV